MAKTIEMFDTLSKSVSSLGMTHPTNPRYPQALADAQEKFDEYLLYRKDKLRPRDKPIIAKFLDILRKAQERDGNTRLSSNMTNPKWYLSFLELEEQTGNTMLDDFTKEIQDSTEESYDESYNHGKPKLSHHTGLLLSTQIMHHPEHQIYTIETSVDVSSKSERAADVRRDIMRNMKEAKMGDLSLGYRIVQKDGSPSNFFVAIEGPQFYFRYCKKAAFTKKGFLKYLEMLKSVLSHFIEEKKEEEEEEG